MWDSSLVRRPLVQALYAVACISATVACSATCEGSSLMATTGVTLGEAPVTPDGTWTPKPPYTPTHSGTTCTVPLPAASAVLLTAR